ncbi:MAG: plasmid mobilization protein [Peptoniphilaceae bacterium]
MINRERDKQLIIRVTEEEKNLIKKKMKLSGINNMSAYARKMMIDGQIFKIDMSDFREFGLLLSRTSTNINQIAKRVNTTNSIYKEDIEEIKEMMTEIWQLQKSILSNLP